MDKANIAIKNFTKTQDGTYTLAQRHFEDLRDTINTHKKGKTPDLDFAPPDDFFDPIFAEERKYNKDSYILGDEFDGNSPLADPNEEGYDEINGAVYRYYAEQTQVFLDGCHTRHYANWILFDTDPPSKFPTEDSIKNHEGYQIVPACVDVDSILSALWFVSQNINMARDIDNNG